MHLAKCMREISRATYPKLIFPDSPLNNSSLNRADDPTFIVLEPQYDTFNN